MKYKILLLLLIVSLVVQAQKTKTNEIIDLSKKYLVQAVGDDLIKYFEHTEDNGSYYKLEPNRFGYQLTKTLFSNRKLKNKWSEVWVRYNFNFPEIIGVKYAVWIKINRNLGLVEDVKLNYIPDFVWQNNQSNFIGIEKAIEIGNENLTKTKLKRTKPELIFDKFKSKYVYKILNRLSQSLSNYGRETGEMEILIIDALNGQVIENNRSHYGILIR